MKTKTVRRIIIIVIIAAFIAATAVLIVQRLEAKRARADVTFTMPANGSSGEYYKYAFDRDDILRETNSYISRFFLNFGPEYYDVWEFDIIGEGELTVNRTKYQGGSDIVKAECFTEIYRVEDGKCQKTFDSRKNT